MNIHICMKCPHRQQVCAGPCPCTVDGRDIIEHAAAGDCPKGFLAAPGAIPPPQLSRAAAVSGIPLAGDVIEGIAKAIGADRLAKLWEKWTRQSCGCVGRRDKLNAATERLLKWWGNRAG